ncbi:LppU/SCO3897 family protein [Micromonospora rifamycinica]|uniref:LppU/SCO3897 family protein n=1 Tax=Micromonospora rifamycinica TaxID=291594 RepID=UPI0009FCB43C
MALIIGLVVFLLLCPCLGVAGWFVLASDDDADPAPVASTSSAPTESGPTEGPTAGPTEGPTEPTGEPTTIEPTPTRADQITKGDCVVNDGTASSADLRKVPCGPDTYEVLLRIPASTNGERCRSLAPGSNANYVHDNSVDLFDYVLCLRKRS